MFRLHNAAGGAAFGVGIAAICVGSLATASRVEAGQRDGRSYLTARDVRVPVSYEVRERIVRQPPVYEIRHREIWVEPVYELQRVRVEVPAQVTTERMPRYSVYGRQIGFDVVERVIVPARTIWEERQVLVQEGYYETVSERVLVQPASTRIIQERVAGRHDRWARARVPFYRTRPPLARPIERPWHTQRDAGFGLRVSLGDSRERSHGPRRARLIRR